MKRVVTSEQMKAFDNYAIETMGMPSLVLMERAALAVVDELKRSDFSLSRVLIVCGSGNNGADGVAIGRILHLSGVNADVRLAGNPEHFSGDLKIQIQIARNYGLSFINNPTWSEYTTIVDAIFGVGLSREISGDYAEMIEQMNHSRALKIAVDIPSGIHGDSGAVMGLAVKVDKTVTFAFAKAGLLLYPGAFYAGQLVIADIGITEPQVLSFIPELYHLDAECLGWIPKRVPYGNKGTFGKALLIAGTSHMSGAACLSGKACLRTGAGMLKIHSREENREILQMQLPEALLSTYPQSDYNLLDLLSGLEWADVVGIGPGIGTSETAEAMLVYLLTHSNKPLVIDADGLNLLKEHLDLLAQYRGPCILTPHLGEMSRLAGQSVLDVKKDLFGIVQSFSQRTHTVCICKDARTVIADPSGELVINLSGNEGMATAGSGDVLTGVLLGLLAQGMDAKSAALCAVYLHGCAGDAAKEQKGSYGLMAHDIIDGLAPVLLKRKG